MKPGVEINGQHCWDILVSQQHVSTIKCDSDAVGWAAGRASGR